MRFDFFIGSVDAGVLSQAQMSVTLHGEDAGRIDFRVWVRSPFQSDRNRNGVHGLVVWCLR